MSEDATSPKRGFKAGQGLRGLNVHPERELPAHVRAYGWRAEFRHVAAMAFDATNFRAVVPKALPPRVSLQADCPKIYDQGKLGSCTANALAAAIEFDLKRTRRKPVTPSRLYIYWNERAQMGTINDDVGASLQLATAVAKELGCCSETLWPYDIRRYADIPPKAAFVEADHLRLAQSAYLDNTNLYALKSCLAAGVPFVFGLAVYQSFEAPLAAATGLIPLPKRTDTLIGGHALMAIGYDDQSKEFLVRNSWGPRWGIDGYCWIPYDYLTNPQLASDFWAIQTVMTK